MSTKGLIFLLMVTVVSSSSSSSSSLPIVINTWSESFAKAGKVAYDTLVNNSSVLDAVVAGCRLCQEEQCDHSVGWGGSPDESGDTTLDAMIMDGDSMDIGAVGYLRKCRDAIGVARAVMEHTSQTLLAGEAATNFAKQMGFRIYDNLESDWSRNLTKNWRANNCQPNYWRTGTVTPDPSKSCGPYTSNGKHSRTRPESRATPQNHDTIAMVAIDAQGSVAAGTSTNGLTFKVVGRVGDSPIPGAGAFADSSVGGCGETGDGDIMMRFAPCGIIVEWMRQGQSPQVACQNMINRMAHYYPSFVGGIVAVNTRGEFGAAAYGWTMNFTVTNSSGTHVYYVKG